MPLRDRVLRARVWTRFPEETLPDNAPAVSIVMPCYNTVRWIEAAVQSVRSQTGIEWELVAVDDAAIDGTYALLSRLASEEPRLRVIRHRHNQGLSAARNTGTSASDYRSPYVLYLDPDDVLVPGALSALVSALEVTQSAPASVGAAVAIDEAGAECDRFVWPERFISGERISFDDIIGGRPLCLCPPSRILFRREALALSGPWDPSMVAIEDGCMYLRVADIGSFVAVGDIVTGYRRYGTSLSCERDRMRRGFQLFNRKRNAYIAARRLRSKGQQ